MINSLPGGLIQQNSGSSSRQETLPQGDYKPVLLFRTYEENG